MKLKLPIVAALVTFAIALPVKAEDNSRNKAEVIGAWAALNCSIEKGIFTHELGIQAMQELIDENPNLINAYIWASISPKAKEALKELAPHVNSDCDDFTLSETALGETLMRYVN